MLGRNVGAWLSRIGFSVELLGRNVSGTGDGTVVKQWDPSSVNSAATVLQDAQVVINFCGSPINVRWTDENRKKITESRVGPTKTIGHALQTLENGPKHWLNVSAVGFYGDTGNRKVTEAEKRGSGFLAETCEQWEDAAHSTCPPDCMLTIPRIGVVLGCDGGMLPQIVRITRRFLGGQLGNGRQYMPWIHIHDVCRLFETMIVERWAGVINVSSPRPEMNSVFMKEMRRACRRPWSPPVPGSAIKWFAPLLGIEPELVLEGQRAIPAFALSRIFKFEHSSIRTALSDLVNKI